VTRAVRAADIPQAPATISEDQLSVNDVIAVLLTRAVGSMTALYLALVFMGLWMTLATWGPLQRIDPYPFPFLLFMDNVVQLVLCLVILVGQRLLSAAADRRADLTFQHAEDIFTQVADLQRHLDRHDQALSRGVSLLQSSPHPWTERHRVQLPPHAIDQAVTLNGRIAAWLTRRLGTMTAFYVALGTQVAWIASAQLGIQHFDRYPYRFMSFLSTLAQLAFMIVIMVGQDVLSRDAEVRSEQTLLDAEAILYECQRMKSRLTAQDRIIASLTDYVNVQVSERLAEAIHDAYGAVHEVGAQAAVAPSQVPAGTLSLGPWAELPEEFKESNRAQAREIGEKLAVIGCLMVPVFDPVQGFSFDDEEVQVLARLEHERWMGERVAQGFEFGPVRGERTRPDLVPWDRLSDEARLRNTQTVRRIPDMLARTGFQVLRHGREAQDRPGEADFDSSAWEILKQAITASAMLVALADGDVTSEEVSALVRKLRVASITHPQRFIRELAAACAFNAVPQAGIRYTDYEGPALAVIRSAAAIVAQKAPAQFDDFRELLAEIAAAVAAASKETGLRGLAAQRRRSNAAALAAVTRAAGPQEAERPSALPVQAPRSPDARQSRITQNSTPRHPERAPASRPRRTRSHIACRIDSARYELQ
jgi:uncharacterized membrane protein